MKTLLLVCLAAAAAGCQARSGPLRMATTTSVDNSGLLPDILPAFSQQAHIAVDVLAVGSGQALQLLKRGDAAVALTHDPDAEAAAIAEGFVTGYQKIMFNDLVIAGPPEDPAGIAHAADAVDAFARIAMAGATFVSRGDGSGTHAREQKLWTLAKRRPDDGHLLDAGQGMAATLRIADEKRAYALTDRATFEQFRSKMTLTPLYEGDPALLNTYAVFARAGLAGRDAEAARALMAWFADGDGRHRIAAFTAHGRQVFTVWPDGAARSTPSDLPPNVLAHAH